ARAAELPAVPAATAGPPEVPGATLSALPAAAPERAATATAAVPPIPRDAAAGARAVQSAIPALEAGEALNGASGQDDQLAADMRRVQLADHREHAGFVRLEGDRLGFAPQDDFVDVEGRNGEPVPIGIRLHLVDEREAHRLSLLGDHGSRQ